MARVVVENLDQFKAFLASQPLCQWAAKKQHDIDSGLIDVAGRKGLHAPARQNDNADLAAALSSMA